MKRVVPWLTMLILFTSCTSTPISIETTKKIHHKKNNFSKQSQDELLRTRCLKKGGIWFEGVCNYEQGPDYTREEMELMRVD